MTDRHDDNDLLAAYDLSAWEAPPPAPGLVDAVIARARQAAPVAALDTGEPLGARGKKRWWIAATVAAVAAAAIVIGLWGVQRTPENGQGEVTATAARTLAIGPTTAALDPGVHVRWRRDKRKISVAQPRGTAMWNVAAEDTLVIDAGAMVASVEASGASLRVEVKMINASDARAIGVSAATAVAVALVTIVVYQGTVRVRHDGQTVNVVPGAHYEVRPPTTPPEPIAVGAGPIDPRIRELEDKVKQLEAERDALKEKSPVTDPCDEVSCVLNNYDGACCKKFKAQVPPKQAVIAETLTRATISEGMIPLKAKVLACPTDSFIGTVKVKVVVAPDGTVTRADASATTKLPAALSSCVEAVVSRATFAKTVLGGSFGYPYTIDEECNADSLRQKGDDHLQTGMDAAALAAFERSMRCRPDPTLVPKAFLAACRSKNYGKAKHYYPMLPESKRALAHVCIRNGIQVGDDTQALTSECDAAALTQKGDDHLQTGMDEAALAAFEKSYACKADPVLVRKLLLSACRAKKGAAAQKYYLMLPSRDRSALAQMCIRNGVPLDETAAPAGGVIKIASTPAARILLDGIDTGKTTPMTLQTKPGNHKVTFVVGKDKYTFNVTVKDGETVSLTKELQ